MNLKSRFALLSAVLVLATAAFTGCGTAQQTYISDQANYAASTKDAPVTAEPELAIEEIYSDVEEYSANELSVDNLQTLTGIDTSNIIECYGMYSDPMSGLADVIIVKPYPGVRDEVRTSLSAFKQTRIQEFENFDIMDACSIAKNAVVYDQGDYLVLLMLPENDTAQETVDDYIPH